ncbi:hypothetical protein GF322_05320 [Candidatus Dependentiae bacterium]|nr:hypothetical protein [Candidatus Dependentiae bacterium]
MELKLKRIDDLKFNLDLAEDDQIIIIFDRGEWKIIEKGKGYKYSEKIKHVFHCSQVKRWLNKRKI